MIGIHFAGDDLSQSRNRLAISCGVVGDGNTHPYEALADYGAERWRPTSFEDADVVVYALPYYDREDTRRVATAEGRNLSLNFFTSTFCSKTL